MDYVTVGTRLRWYGCWLIIGYCVLGAWWQGVECVCRFPGVGTVRMGMGWMLGVGVSSVGMLGVGIVIGMRGNVRDVGKVMGLINWTGVVSVTILTAKLAAGIIDLVRFVRRVTRGLGIQGC